MFYVHRLSEGNGCVWDKVGVWLPSEYEAKVANDCWNDYS